MKQKQILLIIIITAIILITAVAYHSIQEIHYLKSFFPNQFTVEQAKDASIIELVKLTLIAIPLTIIILTSLILIKKN